MNRTVAERGPMELTDYTILRFRQFGGQETRELRRRCTEEAHLDYQALVDDALNTIIEPRGFGKFQLGRFVPTAQLETPQQVDSLLADLKEANEKVLKISPNTVHLSYFLDNAFSPQLNQLEIIKVKFHLKSRVTFSPDSQPDDEVSRLVDPFKEMMDFRSLPPSSISPRELSFLEGTLAACWSSGPDPARFFSLGISTMRLYRGREASGAPDAYSFIRFWQIARELDKAGGLDGPQDLNCGLSPDGTDTIREACFVMMANLASRVDKIREVIKDTPLDLELRPKYFNIPSSHSLAFVRSICDKSIVPEGIFPKPLGW